MTQWIIFFSLLAIARTTKQFQVFLSMFINPIVCIGDQGLSFYLKITQSQEWFSKKNSAGKTSLAMARHRVTTKTFRGNKPPRTVSWSSPRPSSSSLGQSQPTAGKAYTGSLGQDTVLRCSQPTKPWKPTKNHEKP